MDGSDGIEDGAGEKVGGLGTADAPYVVDDYWVYERELGEGGRWQIKARLEQDT